MDDVRLLADGVTLRAFSTENHVHRFHVPARTRSLRIQSPVFVPADRNPMHADQRRLGISLVRLAFRSPGMDLDLPADDDLLHEGFHAPEPGHRWTDGDAALPPSLLAGFTEPFTLELHLNPQQSSR